MHGEMALIRIILPPQGTKLGVAAEKQQAHAYSLIFSSETIDTSLRRIVANYYSHQDTARASCSQETVADLKSA